MVGCSPAVVICGDMDIYDGILTLDTLKETLFLLATCTAGIQDVAVSKTRCWQNIGGLISFFSKLYRQAVVANTCVKHTKEDRPFNGDCAQTW